MPKSFRDTVPSAARTGFFADKNRAFWTLQIGGWAGYFLLRFLGGLANRMGIGFILPAIIVTVTGFSITLLMGLVYRTLIRMRPVWMWSLSSVVLLLGSMLFSAIEVWAHATFYEPGWQPRGIEFFGAILLTLAILGAWTGLYYGINYYLMVSVQTERLQRMEAQASAAQLRMLRYQINPHFLFNTLNSISTLVLLHETEKANTMLSRLSSFLRYSLVGERDGQATVAQEMQALRQYLDIERTRFEARLRVTFDIAADVENACIPSLLLQPLVENAIKYAVTPQEEGADIRIAASRNGEWLELVVADSGPGIGEQRPVPGGTGVGLANIRERLSQAYGTRHSFEILPNTGSGGIQATAPTGGEPKGHGILVRMEIPLHYAVPEAPANGGVLPGHEGKA